jgi:hypothetical protein
MQARQMGGKRATIGAALSGAGASVRLILLVVGGFASGDGLLDILKRQGELVRIELLGAAAKLHALQLMQEMQQAVVPRQRLVARRKRSVALGERRRKPRLQLGDVGQRMIRALAHDPKRIRFARGRDQQTTN